MVKKDDLRIIKTKRSIKNALYDLSTEKPFEKISVMDITTKAMINRSTFYLHYKDKDDLLHSLAKETLNDLKECYSSSTQNSFEKSKTSDEPLPYIVPTLSYIKDNPDFFRLILNSNVKYTFYQNLAKELAPIILALIPDYKPDKIILKYGPNILINAISCTFTKWIKTEMKESPEEIAALLTKMSLAVLMDNHI